MPTKMHWLVPGDPPDSFPDVDQAQQDPNGLLAIGGDLSVGRLLAAYRRGIFPWYEDTQPILWWSPDPRTVLFPPELRVSRSLRRTLRKNSFLVSVDQDFGGVIAGCSADREKPGTWITSDMQCAYQALYEQGHAHSIEVWFDGQLAGGLYGVNVGGAFFGESMFTRRADASKVALVQLVNLCRDLGISLIDCQLATAHLASLGARAIPRDAFQDQLRRLTAIPSPRQWSRPPAETSHLRAENA